MSRGPEVGTADGTRHVDDRTFLMETQTSPAPPDLSARRTPTQAPRCDCRSDERSLVLLSANLAEDYPELMIFGDGNGNGWRPIPEFGAVRIELGTARQFAGVAELVNFLRGILDPPRLGTLRAAWIDRNRQVEDELARLLHAGPLLDMAPNDSSPLLGILQDGRLETWYQPIVTASGGRSGATSA